MSAAHLNERGFPLPMTAKERRRLAALEAHDREHRGCNERPVEDTERWTGFDRCFQSKYGTHSFTVEKGRRCSYCDRTIEECRVKP